MASITTAIIRIARMMYRILTGVGGGDVEDVEPRDVEDVRPGDVEDVGPSGGRIAGWQ